MHGIKEEVTAGGGGGGGGGGSMDGQEEVHVTQAATGDDLQQGRGGARNIHRHSERCMLGCKRRARWAPETHHLYRLFVNQQKTKVQREEFDSEFRSPNKQTNNNTLENIQEGQTSPRLSGLTREDEFLLHDIEVSAGPPDGGGAQHDLFRVVAAHPAHPIPAGSHVMSEILSR